MSTFSFHMSRQQIVAKTNRIILTACVALMFSVTFIVIQEPAAVYAAPSAATGGRYDRRPDRERPVVADTSTQGTSSTTTSSGSSSSSATSQARPRLVRR